MTASAYVTLTIAVLLGKNAAVAWITPKYSRMVGRSQRTLVGKSEGTIEDSRI